MAAHLPWSYARDPRHNIAENMHHRIRKRSEPVTPTEPAKNLLNRKHPCTTTKPFLQTRFGRLPPEIRQMIFFELRATPPSYAGHDFAACSSKPKSSVKPPQEFVHIRASWHQVTGTCRPIYIESRPVFFASRSYYVANAQELKSFLQEHEYPPPARAIFRWDTITSLCVKGLVKRVKSYTKEQIDNILSDPTSHVTREHLESRTFQTFEPGIYLCIRSLENLKTICLCICVGE